MGEESTRERLHACKIKKKVPADSCVSKFQPRRRAPRRCSANRRAVPHINAAPTSPHATTRVDVSRRPPRPDTPGERERVAGLPRLGDGTFGQSTIDASGARSRPAPVRLTSAMRRRVTERSLAAAAARRQPLGGTSSFAPPRAPRRSPRFMGEFGRTPYRLQIAPPPRRIRRRRCANRHARSAPRPAPTAPTRARLLYWATLTPRNPFDQETTTAAAPLPPEMSRRRRRRRPKVPRRNPRLDRTAATGQRGRLGHGLGEMIDDGYDAVVADGARPVRMAQFLVTHPPLKAATSPTKTSGKEAV